MDYEVQYSETDGRVWVHCSDGSTVGRFNKRSGIDIHNSVSQQLSGEPECLHCTHGETSRAEWDIFVHSARDLWGVNIDPNFINY